MSEAYIHGFSAWESQRLVEQARALAPQVFRGLDFGTAHTLLEIGCAVGAELQILRERWPHLALTGVDRGAPQIAAARELLDPAGGPGAVDLMCANACSLPLPPGSFDRVLTIWTLEHIPETEAVLREALRVTRPDGQLILTEVDNHTFRFSPGCEAIAEWWRRFNQCQLDAGGNPYVGRTLAEATRRAGARGVTEEALHIINSREVPGRRAEFLDYLEDLLLSGSEAMHAGGYATPTLERAMREDFARARSDPRIDFQYHAVRVTGRPPSIRS